MRNESVVRVKWGLFEFRGRLRRLVDLQFESILKSLASVGVLPEPGLVLDIGAGTAPWREYFPNCSRYVTVDPEGPADFRSLESVTSDVRANLILLMEVLEHVQDVSVLLAQAKSRLSPEGRLVISVPWSARVHGAPEDFQRWTPRGLETLLKEAGFQIVEWRTRGSDLVTIANKILVALGRRILRPRTYFERLWSLIAAVFVVPPVLVWGHLALHCGWGRGDDPLGFLVVVKRSRR